MAVGHRSTHLQQRPLLPLGTAATVLLMLVLCVPAGWHAYGLLDRHGPVAMLRDLPPIELLLTGALLALPFVTLWLLRIQWQAKD